MEDSELDNTSDRDDAKTEFFFDKTEYHSIMAEALKTTLGDEVSVVPPEPGPATEAEKEEEKGNNRTFYLLALVYCVVVLAVGFVAYVLTET